MNGAADAGACVMSLLERLDAVYALELPATEKAVLLALAYRAGRGMPPAATPSGATLAKDTGLHRATVMASLIPLEQRNLIRRERRKGGTSTQYTLLIGPYQMPLVSVAQRDSVVQRDSRAGRQSVSRRTTQDVVQGDTNKEVTRKELGNACASDRTPDGFAAFWAAYPRKVARERAIKAWRKLSPNESTQTALMAGLERAKRSQQWRKDRGEFVPYPATWLNERRWEDGPTLPATVARLEPRPAPPPSPPPMPISAEQRAQGRKGLASLKQIVARLPAAHAAGEVSSDTSLEQPEAAGGR